jgi:hypothetical protein
LNEIILDQTILQPRTLKRLSPREDFDQWFLQEFKKLEDLVSNIYQALYKSHFRQSFELSSLSIAATSINPQKTHSVPPNHTSSTSSVTSPPIT